MSMEHWWNYADKQISVYQEKCYSNAADLPWNGLILCKVVRGERSATDLVNIGRRTKYHIKWRHESIST